MQLAAETSIEDIVSTLSEGAVPRLIVIDSIQTMWTDTVESAPGTVTLSQPHWAITSAEKPEGIASQPLTAALPACQRSLSLLSAILPSS